MRFAQGAVAAVGPMRFAFLAELEQLVRLAPGHGADVRSAPEPRSVKRLCPQGPNLCTLVTMKPLIYGAAAGVLIGWITAPFVAAALNPRHPDETPTSYWDRVGNSWWWRMRRAWGAS